MSALQEYYNSLGGATVKRTGLQDYYNTLASKGRKRLYEAEVKDTGISPSLYSQLRSGGLIFAVIGFVIIWYIKN